MKAGSTEKGRLQAIKHRMTTLSGISIAEPL